MQSMGFNGLFDIPQLFMILLVIASYAFRKVFPIGYAKFNVFLVYYISYALVVKFCYGILSHINYIDYKLENNQDLKFVKALKLIFGDR